MQATPSITLSPAQAAAANTAEIAVVGKISRRLLWFIFLLFVFSFLDRINIGFAGLTMVKDLGLTSTQFGLATTLFYIAYICCGIPSNVVLARIGARRWIGTIMIAWGLASTATMFAHDPRSLYMLRILVGITEAGFLPGMLLYMTLWFPPAYRARANALFMIAQPVTAALGSAVSGYLLALDGSMGLKGWQWLFMLEGLPSVLLGLVVFYYLDDKPQEAKWLTVGEKAILANSMEKARIAKLGNAASQAFESSRSLFAELTSPTIIKFALAYFCLVNTLAMVAVWTPLIVKSFSADASNRTVGLLAAIPQIVTIIITVWWGRRSDRKQERRWHLMLPMLLAAVGLLCLTQTGHPVLQMVGICLAAAGSTTAMSIFWTTPDQALSFKAQAIGIALINAGGNISSAANPVIVGWLKDTTHSYSAGLIYGTVLLIIGAFIVMRLPISKAKRLPA
jgi:ACS family 4-hydroxyphenylacetate permease-like MFS transporter